MLSRFVIMRCSHFFPFPLFSLDSFFYLFNRSQHYSIVLTVKNLQYQSSLSKNHQWYKQKNGSQTHIYSWRIAIGSIATTGLLSVQLSAWILLDLMRFGIIWIRIAHIFEWFSPDSSAVAWCLWGSRPSYHIHAIPDKRTFRIWSTVVHK